MVNDIKLAGTRRKSLTTMMAALLAGSIAATAGGAAYAKTDGPIDPAKFQQRIEKRVDKALGSTDATADQKKKVTEILQTAFKDMKGFHNQRVENRKAMEAAMQAPTIDAAKIEQIRAEQMKIADTSSKRFTQALVDAGNVLNASQRQAFFKTWNERRWHRG
ncbi:MAG TPA: periplasmic heavy metal sensor [Reyranella sp.]|nr:periplasmic heavy metal sensor [Reyranella sp.]